MGLTERTYYRWKRRKIKTDSYENGRPNADHSNPRNKLPTEARHQIIEVCNQPEYASKAPCEIVPDLADKGTYIASESTFYRVLREEKMQNHRGRSEAPKSKKPTIYRSTVPNQVYMWDITHLNGPHKDFLLLISEEAVNHKKSLKSDISFMKLQKRNTRSVGTDVQRATGACLTQYI